MGFYIEVPQPKGKVGQLVDLFGAKHYNGSFEDVPKDKTLICVVQNGPFDAVGIAYDREEYDVFKDQRTLVFELGC